MEKKRLEWIDIYKGIGILAMIIGHINVNKAITTFIYSFHMPLFFYISGYLFNKEKTKLGFKKFIYRKAKSLLLPYIIFGLFYILLDCVIQKKFNINNVYSLLVDNTNGLPIESALWFLTALFFVEIFYWIYSKIEEKYNSFKKIKFLLIFLGGFIGFFELKIFPFRLPYSIGPAFVGLIFYAIGNVCRQKNIFDKKIFNLNNIYYIVSFFILLGLALYNKKIDMRDGIYNNILISLIVSFGFIMLTIKLSKHINNNCMFIKKYLKSVGQDSISYLCLNHLPIRVNNALLCKFISIVIYQKILNIFISCTILYLLNYIIMETKLKKALGK